VPLKRKKSRTALPEIRWSPLARARLQEIRAFIAMDKPSAADRLATRIVACVELLRLHPHLGRPGPESGLRELIIGGTPYLIRYRPRKKQTLILTILHTAQTRTP